MIRMRVNRNEDRDIVLPKLKMVKEILGWDRRRMIVYVLCNYNTSHERDLERVYKLRDMGYNPYIMVFDKANTKANDKVRRLQRLVNNRYVFNSVERFEDYE